MAWVESGSLRREAIGQAVLYVGARCHPANIKENPRTECLLSPGMKPRLVVQSGRVGGAVFTDWSSTDILKRGGHPWFALKALPVALPHQPSGQFLYPSEILSGLLEVDADRTSVVNPARGGRKLLGGDAGQLGNCSTDFTAHLHDRSRGRAIA